MNSKTTPSIAAMSSGLDQTRVGAWAEVTAAVPCPICGKPDWCARTIDSRVVRCQREGLRANTRTDKHGAEYWIHHLADDGSWTGGPLADSRFQSLSRENRPYAPHIERLPADLLHHGYLALLESLTLEPRHFEALRSRCLPAARIDAGAFRTLSRNTSRQAAEAVRAALGADCARLPGLVRDDDSLWTLNGPHGLAIPVRDVAGRIVAIKVRRDREDDGPKYLYLSSRRRGGTSPGSPVHVPLHEGISTRSARITEGELKAEVTTALSGRLTISIAGIGSWASAIPVLRRLRVRELIFAPDGDVETTLTSRGMFSPRSNISKRRAINEVRTSRTRKGYRR